MTHRRRAGKRFGRGCIACMGWVVAAVSAAAPAAAQPRRSQRYVYAVDLQRAVLATPAGRKIKADLERMRRREEAVIRQRETALEQQRGTLAVAVYKARYREIQALIKKAESKLESEQDRLLAPVLADFRTLIRGAQAPGISVLDTSVEAPIGLDARCDRTVELVRAFGRPTRSERPSLGAPDEACRYRGFLFVQFDRVLRDLPESRVAVARLDGLKQRRQRELEGQKKRLEEIRARARSTGDGRWREEAEHRARQLDDSFETFQTEIQKAELEAEDKLYQRVERTILDFARRQQGLLFVEYFEERPDRPPSCEVSRWVVRLLRQQVGLSSLRKMCAWIR